LAIFATNASRKKFIGLRKGRHPDVEVQGLDFVHERRKNGQPVTSDTIRNKAKELTKVLNIPNQEFKASRGWVDRFMKRAGLSLRRRTTICQKFPMDFEKKLQSFQRYVITLRKEKIFSMGQIGNADETPIWFDMPCNYIFIVV
jgi:Tc5 transposase DNA-binding domain.